MSSRRTLGLGLLLPFVLAIALLGCAAAPPPSAVGTGTAPPTSGASSTTGSAPRVTAPGSTTSSPSTTAPSPRSTSSAPTTSLAASGSGACSPRGLPADVVATVDSARSFILAAADPSGAIRQHTDADRVDPYLGSYAAMGLARVGAATCDRATLDAVWAYLEWYQSAMDADGFVSDQVLEGSAPVPTGERDSTDAYAGMFLVALAEAHRAEPSLDRLRPLAPAISRALAAIGATTGADGLSRAAPEWPVAYLMDQAEVYAGITAAAELLDALGDARGSAAARTSARQVRAGVDALWDQAAGGYRWAVHEDGATESVDWGSAYPDVASQAMALAWGLVPPDRVPALRARVDAGLPWRDPFAPATVDGRTEQVGWWPVAAWSAPGTDEGASVTAAGSLQAAADASTWAWPYNVGVAGQLIVAAMGGWSPTVSNH